MKIRFKFLTVLLFAFSLSFAGCLFGGDDSDDSSSTTPTYTVTFDAQGGSAVDPQTVTSGGLVTEPAAQTRSYYTFGGWFREAACTNVWTFATDTVTSDITLYAKWTHNEWEDFSVNPILYDVTDGSLDAAGSIFDLQGTANGDVYIAGEFEQFKGQTIRSVAKLSGSTWSQVGTDLDPNSTVHSICITPSGDIYIGGTFGYNVVFGQPAADGPKAFAKLTSGTWDNVTHASTDGTDFYGTPLTSRVCDMICGSDGKIYVVGTFAYAGGTAAGNIWNSFAILNSGSWTGFNNSGFQQGSDPGTVREIFFDEAGTGLYVTSSGGFNKVHGTTWDTSSSGAWAYWNGSAWGAPSYDYGAGHPVHFNADGSCYKKAAASESEAYFAGLSTDGSTYTSDASYSGTAKSISVFGPDGTPYKYGIFTSVKWNSNTTSGPVAHTVTANCIVKWNGSEWVAFGNLPTDTVKQVSRVFFTPNGDMWITTRNDTIEYAFGPNSGTNLYRIKK